MCFWPHYCGTSCRQSSRIKAIFSSIGENIGVLAGIFQFIAYLIYIRYFLKDSIKPNALSWIMFAYGTAFMVFLEWRAGATWDLLLLPLVCATMSIFVAVMCLRSPTRTPTSPFERWTFAADLGLTFGYLALSNTSAAGPLFTAAFILTGNLTAITAFVPILASTYKSPENEKATPWAFWAFAYLLLTIATLFNSSLRAPELLIYPVLGVALHGGMALIIINAKKTEKPPLLVEKNYHLGPSNIAGVGVFAAVPFEAGGVITTLSGARIVGAGPLEQDPNWVGVGKDEWINPTDPIAHINHSCAPNSAFGDGLELRAVRPIARGEEITFDYSTTEADLTWRMPCTCGAPACRKTLTSIQTAFADASEPPPALPAMQLIWRDHQKSLTATNETSETSEPLFQITKQA